MCLIDESGSTVWSAKVVNDEAAILEAVGQVLSRARQVVPLQPPDHRSVQALERDSRDWVTAWNQNPKPFIWTKTADQTLESLGRLLKRTTGEGH